MEANRLVVATKTVRVVLRVVVCSVVVDAKLVDVGASLALDPVVSVVVFLDRCDSGHS